LRIHWFKPCSASCEEVSELQVNQLGFKSKYIKWGRHSYGSPEIFAQGGGAEYVEIGNFCSIANRVKL